MTVVVNWRGREVSKATRLKAARILADVSGQIVTNTRANLEAAGAVRTGRLLRSYGEALDAEHVSDHDRLDVQALARQLYMYVGSTLSYARAVETGHGTFSGHWQLFTALDQTKRDVPKTIKKYRD